MIFCSNRRLWRLLGVWCRKSAEKIGVSLELWNSGGKAGGDGYIAFVKSEVAHLRGDEQPNFLVGLVLAAGEDRSS